MTDRLKELQDACIKARDANRAAMAALRGYLRIDEMQKTMSLCLDVSGDAHKELARLRGLIISAAGANDKETCLAACKEYARVMTKQDEYLRLYSETKTRLLEANSKLSDFYKDECVEYDDEYDDE